MLSQRALPIGLFDSGIGGLTIAEELLTSMPSDGLLYLGDSDYGPYGGKSLALVRNRCVEIAETFQQIGVKALVTACNTASAAALRDLRERVSVPVFDVVVPTARAALRSSGNRRIGVLATEATVTSRVYDDAFGALPDVSVHSMACPEFVEYLEHGIGTTASVTRAAERYLAPLLAAGVDTVVLGCTHYSLLSGVLQDVARGRVRFISSATAVAQSLREELADRDLLADPAQHGAQAIYTTEETEDFDRKVRRHFGQRFPLSDQLTLPSTSERTLLAAASS